MNTPDENKVPTTIPLPNPERHYFHKLRNSPQAPLEGTADADKVPTTIPNPPPLPPSSRFRTTFYKNPTKPYKPSKAPKQPKVKKIVTHHHYHTLKPKLYYPQQIPNIPISKAWRAWAMEYIATLLFVFFATGGVIVAQRYGTTDYAAVVLVALAQGLALSAFVYSSLDTSGGNLNPAVTLALVATKRMIWWRGLIYLFLQLAGAITASAVLYGVVPDEFHQHLGATTPGVGVSNAKAFGFELVLTFALVWVVFATAVDPVAVSKFAPLAIGFTLTVALLVGWTFTGASLNPARSFGPAVISGTWHGHWIYWVGPLIGGLAAGLIYEFVMIPKSTSSSGNANNNNSEQVEVVKEVIMDIDAPAEREPGSANV